MYGLLGRLRVGARAGAVQPCTEMSDEPRRATDQCAARQASPFDAGHVAAHDVLAGPR